MTLRTALAGATEDQLLLDLAGIENRYHALTRELPGLRVRFAVKACPADEVLAVLAANGAGFDAASPGEIGQALRTGVGPDRIHYGNTIKSDHDIAAAYRLGIRDFATDTVADVRAIAAHAPGSRVFCRLATSGAGALWGLSDKFGCTTGEAVTALCAAADHGLVPAGLSLHVGSQQTGTRAWRAAFATLTTTIRALDRRGIHLDHVNLGGGLPAEGYLDRRGRPRVAHTGAMLAAITAGMRRLREIAPAPLELVMEPGRHLVADHGAIRAHVVRLTSRRHRDGSRRQWLFLSCGRFNGLYETDQLRYRLEFPDHGGERLTPAVIAGPTCDSDDVLAVDHPVPSGLRSGDPVWIFSTGAYSLSYATRGFNGFDALPHRALGDDLAPAGRERMPTA
ncbi:type III PLP-dependent enzyme [Actinoplanes octamycinicus]|nr:type III PLP-dependent enzyme [Actinoplanes octamycinicus]GIE58577.1 lysine/ornithine decarboxylase [Actinoplanes octamycinicus]